MSFGDKNFTYGPRIVKDGLVFYVDAANPKSYVSGDTTCNDLIQSNNGTLINGPTFDTNNGGSIVFDGSDDSVSISSMVSYSSDDPHTYSAWVNAVNTTSYKWILNNGGSTNGTSLIIYGGYMGFFWRGGGAVRQGIIPININTWYNLTVSYNGSDGTYDMYVNGILDTSSNTSSATAGSGVSWVAGTSVPIIGSWYNGSFDYNGKVSNVKIYNRALSSTEILQNYNALKPRFGL
tara:strand:+ start:491 stop:1195 length:705 start_codon:yes stop_codon:yes gene_type:complete